MDAQCYEGDFLPYESQLAKNYTRLLVGAFNKGDLLLWTVGIETLCRLAKEEISLIFVVNLN